MTSGFRLALVAVSLIPVSFVCSIYFAWRLFG